MPHDLKDDCFLHDKDRLKHAEALAILKENIRPLAAGERVPLHEAAGRILHEAIIAPRPIPLTDNAAVDGYAFAHADYLAADGNMPVSGRIAAGDLNPPALPSGHACRIFTGATMPAGADSVVMQEDTRSEDDKQVLIPAGLKAGANCRKAGEDVAAGQALLAAGTFLRPQDIAAVASIGQAEIDVARRLRVGVFSTGDELVQPGENIAAGQVFDANRPLLMSLMASLPVSLHDLGILPDDREVVFSSLEAAARTHDVLITTGGASRGEEDHVIKAIEALGTRHMWQLAIKPGRPMSFGTMGQTTFMGLPGNPVAAMVCFLLYVRPLLLRLCGADWQEPTRYMLPAGFAIRSKKTDRREFLRGILRIDGGQLIADKYARDGSGLISSLRESDGLIELPEDVSTLSKGDPVAFLPYTAFGLPPRGMQ